MDAPAVSKRQALALHYARRIAQDQRSTGLWQEPDLQMIQSTLATAIEGAFHSLDWEYECRTACAMDREAETRFEVQTI